MAYHSIRHRVVVSIWEEGFAMFRVRLLQRLHALVAKGYRPTLGVGDNIDSIVLRHRARTPDLVLHADGVVEGLGGRLPFYKRDLSLGDPIGAGGDDQQLRFLQLLNAVPRASLRDRTRRFRHRYVYLPLAMGAIADLVVGLVGVDEGRP